MQAKAVHPRGSRELAVEGEVAVDPVAHDGEPACGRLDTQLVGATGDRLETKEGQTEPAHAATLEGGLGEGVGLPRSIVLDQVSAGLPVRMAVIERAVRGLGQGVELGAGLGMELSGGVSGGTNR